MPLAVFRLRHHENQWKNKHVESTLVPRLDEGSSPSSSTPPLIALTSVPRPELFLCRLAPVMRREGAKGLWLITRATAAHKDSMILAIMVEIYTCKYTYSILMSNNFNSVACRF